MIRTEVRGARRRSGAGGRIASQPSRRRCHSVGLSLVAVLVERNAAVGAAAETATRSPRNSAARCAKSSRAETRLSDAGAGTVTVAMRSAASTTTSRLRNSPRTLGGYETRMSSIDSPVSRRSTACAKYSSISI